MGHRAYSRQANGRFRRATLENTFGLSAPSCPDCGRLNPHSAMYRHVTRYGKD